MIETHQRVDAVQARHLPVENRKARGVVALQDAPSLSAVFRDDGLVSFPGD